jgi:hypothetical protein
VEQVRVLSASIQEMAPMIARAAELRTVEPELAAQLDLYKSQLRELQTTLDQIRLMLLTKRAQMLTRGGNWKRYQNGLAPFNKPNKELMPAIKPHSQSE